MSPGASVDEGGAPRGPPVLLLDTLSLFFRAYHALPSMSTRHGVPTSGLYGLSALLLKLEHLASHHRVHAIDSSQTQVYLAPWLTIPSPSLRDAA